MIKTEFDGSFDLKAAIAPGTRVAIIGCANCASVFGTGDTKRIKEVSDQLKDHCSVVVATSVDSPCDQRVLRYLLKTVPRLEEAEILVVLACEAGSRSVGTLLAEQGRSSRTTISPVRTVDFCVMGSNGQPAKACRFCDLCHSTDKERLCPVASCPVARLDGPCQNRLCDDCVVDPSRKCSWLI